MQNVFTLKTYGTTITNEIEIFFTKYVKIQMYNTSNDKNIMKTVALFPVLIKFQ